MQDRPVFQSQAQAIEVLFTMNARLGSLVMWTLFICVHLALACGLLLGVWCLQVAPGDVWDWLQRMQQTRPAAVLSVLGLSAGTLGAAYAWLVRKLHRAAGTTWLFAYLTRGL